MRMGANLDAVNEVLSQAEEDALTLLREKLFIPAGTQS